MQLHSVAKPVFVFEAGGHVGIQLYLAYELLAYFFQPQLSQTTRDLDLSDYQFPGIRVVDEKSCCGAGVLPGTVCEEKERLLHRTR